MNFFSKSFKLLISFCLALCLLTGCQATPPEPIVNNSTESSSNIDVETPKTVEGTETSQIEQYYALDDFIVCESDEVLFKPQSNDYIKTEVYWQGNESYMSQRLAGAEAKPITLDIIFHLTKILEFDDTGKLIAQREKYTFQTDWVVPKDVYFQDMIDRADYTNVKLVEQVIYADVAKEYLNTEKSKQDYIEHFTQENSKFYMSVPARTSNS